MVSINLTRWDIVGILLLTTNICLLYSYQPVSIITPELMKPNSNLTTADILAVNKTREKYFIVFLIPSHPQRFNVRDAIRRTWMNVNRWNNLTSIDEQYKRIKVMFLFGSYTDSGDFDQEFYDELKEHDDMYMISNLREHKTALKYKVLWGTKQALHHYDFDYIVKTDDDIVVNLPVLITDLIALPRDRYYTGNCNMKYGDFNGYPKWKYCSGGGYVFSRDVASKFQELPSSVHQVPFRPEDAYTGYLVNRLREVLGYKVQIVPNPKLKVYGYKCGPFVGWFYHSYSTAKKHEVLYKKIRTDVWVPCSEPKGK